MYYGKRIEIFGCVQGVGMRPFLYSLAKRHGLMGFVQNTVSGVKVEIWGIPENLQLFIQQVQPLAPSAAEITKVGVSDLSQNECPKYSQFSILQSSEAGARTLMPDDRKICNDCLAELLDPNNRRYHHEFIHCVNCGPRYSIITQMPYDRANTSMAEFAMCRECNSEYETPGQRRFHSHTNACHQCGPQYWYQPNSAIAQDIDTGLESSDPVFKQTAKRLQQGDIIAIKGTGGFRIACMASSKDTIQRLRTKKNRPDKPLAIMVKDVDMAMRYACLSAEDIDQLESSANPILLLKKKYSSSNIAENVTGDLTRIGIMLPSNAFEYLLLQALDEPLAMTSGNISGCPQLIHNEEAQDVLSSTVDGFVFHNRVIAHRLDDSVLNGGAVKFYLRRSKGLSGLAISTLRKPRDLNKPILSVLAMGADLKNSFAIGIEEQVVVSPYIGDLNQADVADSLSNEIHQLLSIHRTQPTLIAVDSHPNYYSSQFGRQLQDTFQCELMEIQHHHAHIAAVMIEHGLPNQNVIGVAFDGIGAGTNNELWGGEFFVCDYLECQRIASVDAIPLIGGDKASREPWRNLFAHLSHYHFLGSEYTAYPLVQQIKSDGRFEFFSEMIGKNLHCPKASSIGRLFDAVAAALDLYPNSISYEGQAAQGLEQLAQESGGASVSGYALSSSLFGDLSRWSWKDLWLGILSDLKFGVSKEDIAAKFHETLSSMTSETISKIAERQQISTVVLSGGVMQNQLLRSSLKKSLEAKGLSVFLSEKFPSHDGGIALGQIAIAQSRYAST